MALICSQRRLCQECDSSCFHLCSKSIKKGQLDTVGLKTGANRNPPFGRRRAAEPIRRQSAAQVAPCAGANRRRTARGGGLVGQWEAQMSARRRASWNLGGFSEGLKVNKSCFAGRLEDRRGSAQALGLAPFRDWPALICTQRCSLLCGRLGDVAAR